MTEYLELRAVAFDLIKFIVKKYDIKDYEGFTCPLQDCIFKLLIFAPVA